MTTSGTPIFDTLVEETEADIPAILTREKWSFAEANRRIMKEINTKRIAKNEKKPRTSAKKK